MSLSPFAFETSSFLVGRTSLKYQQAYERYRLATAKYEPQLDTAVLNKHRDNQVRLTDIITKRLRFIASMGLITSGYAIPNMLLGNKSAGPNAKVDLPQALFSLLNEAQFDPSIYLPREANAIHGYGKYLLYTDHNNGSPYCLQIFAFSPIQYTPIHDHPCSCTAVVMQGKLQESRYRDMHSNDGFLRAMKYGQEIRPPGHQATLVPTRSNIHSLKNIAEQTTVSVHLYFMDGITNIRSNQDRAVREIYKPYLRSRL